MILKKNGTNGEMNIYTKNEGCLMRRVIDSVLEI